MQTSLRAYATAGVALVGAGLIVVTPVAAPSPNVQVRAVQLASGDTLNPGDTTVALLTPGSGVPLDPPEFVENINKVFIEPNFGEATPIALSYPAQLYPIFGIHNGFFDSSVQVGITVLNNAIAQQLADGNHVVAEGHSQGATVVEQEMTQLAASAHPPSSDQLDFLVTGDPSFPNGGALARLDYPGLSGNASLPSLGITAYSPAPADTPWHLIDYNAEYDGFADYPKYPLDVLADLNAVAGTIFVHENEDLLPASTVDQAYPLPTSPGYDGNITYLMIPTENLPLLDPLRTNPMGNAIADLLQPDLKVLVNLGYGPDNLPYSGDANVTTPFGLFPDVNLTTLFDNLVTGAKEGAQNFLADLKDITPSSMMAAMTANAGPAITPLDLDPSNFLAELQTLLNDNINALSTVIVAPLDLSMPLVDTFVGFATAIPNLDANLVLAGLSELSDGNLQNAMTDFTGLIGGPVGLLSLQDFLFLPGILVQPVSTITSAIQSVATENMDFLAGLPGLF